MCTRIVMREAARHAEIRVAKYRHMVVAEPDRRAMKRHLHSLLHRFGFDLVPYSGRYFQERWRIELIKRLNVDLVIDVGANEGQWGRELRRGGYDGRIVSFEPLADACARLSRTADRRWQVYNLALGSSAHRTIIHRSRNSWSSSLLPITETHVAAAPDAAFVQDQEVEVRTLDSFGFTGRLYVKVDAQGYEEPVIDGAESTLASTVAMELELTQRSLYDGQALMGELVARLWEKGYTLASLAPAFVDSVTKETLQFNGIFIQRAE